MLLARIDLDSGRTTEELQQLSRGIPDAILADHGIPKDAGLGFERPADAVVIPIFTQGGQSQEAKQSRFSAVAAKLGELGIAGEDVFIGYVENRAAAWSLGIGRAEVVL